MPSFLEIQQDCYDQLGQAQTPPAATSRRIKRFINTWHRRIVSSPGMDPLRRIVLTNASVANQQVYGIVVNTILTITESSTQRILSKQTLGWYRAHYPAPSLTTGTPDYWIPMGTARIHTRPSIASELFIVSTQAADAGTVKIEAIRSNGYHVTLSHVLTGTTPVSLDTTMTDIVDVINIYVSAAQTGVVTVTQGSGGTELSRIPIGQTIPKFFRYALALTPSSAITYTIDAIADLVDLVQDYDEPLVPIDFQDVLVKGAMHDEFTQLGKLADARFLINGGNATRPSPESILGRLSQLRATLFEWPDNDGERASRSFEETIHLPIT